MNNISDYANVVCIPIIIAILALASPLILQTITRIDEKYQSTRLSVLFYKEFISRLFIIILIISLISTMVWGLGFKHSFDWGKWTFLIDNSALIFILSSTVVNILMLFLIIRLVLIYYNPLKLFKRISNRYYKNQKKGKHTLLHEISDILVYSIIKQNEELARRTVSFLFEIFIESRKNAKGQEIEYSQEYYDLIFEANEQFCLNKRKGISSYNGSIFINMLIDDFQETIISEKTYIAIWWNLRQAITLDRDDVVMSYWKNAHQHFSLNLQPLIAFNEEIDKEEIKKRENERTRFIELNYALGGLLTYSKQYNLIKRIINYSPQNPPKYILVPETLIEVINQYMKTKDYIYNPLIYEQRYNFPDIDGANTGGVIRMWIKKYLAILFIRQYTLCDSYYGNSSMELPNTPTSLSEMNRWKNELVYFSKLIDDVLKDKNLLVEIGLEEFIDKEWFSRNEKEEPKVLIDTLINLLNENYKKTKETQDVSKDKEELFYEKTQEIMLDTYQKYSEIFNSSTINSNYKRFFINGNNQLMDKTAFSDNQDVFYLDSYTTVARKVSTNFKASISGIFKQSIKKRYIFNPDILFEAINKMKFDLENYVIVSFGVNIQHYKDELNVKLTKKDGFYFFEKAKIIEIGSFMGNSLSESLIVISKNELPQIEYHKIDDVEVKKYNINNELNEDYHLSAKVNNLNSNPELLEEIKKYTRESNLLEKVLVGVFVKIEIKWADIRNSYQFKVYNQFSDKEIANTFDDLEQFRD